MKGLEEYIKVHGKHFTERLAYKAAGRKWNSKQVKDAAQRKVYYNVTGATLGDMVYLANMAYYRKGWSKSKCIDFCLAVIGDYGVGEGFPLKHYTRIQQSPLEIDFTPYI